MYSWEEYLLMRKHYGDGFKVVAVWSSPQTRYRRLAVRSVRPLTSGEARSRDKAEIENTNKGGPIAIAEYLIVNEGTLRKLRTDARRLLTELK
jgi:dephospho-CoA kinase